MGRRPVEWLDAAGALYLAGVRSRTSLDKVVARFLRDHAGLGDAGRAFVVDAAQGMWRTRARLEAAVKSLPYEPTRGALASLYLVGARDVPAGELPIDARGAAALKDAWRATDALPLDVRTGVPKFVIDALGDVDEAWLAALTSAPPQTLRVNTLMGTRIDAQRALEDEGVPTEATAMSPEGLVAVERKNVFRTKAFHDGRFEVQDEGSQLIARLCEAKPGMVVVDGCAGAGGKTLHLAALMEGKGTLHAFDTAGHRLEALRERARRAGAHNVRVHEDVRDKKRLGADVVLVDAPCSGTGVFRRNPDTAWRLVPDDVERLVVEQGAILDGYAPLVKPGGRLVYATCSLLDVENDDVVDAFLARTPGFTRMNARAIFARQEIEVPAGDDDALRLDPLHHGTDGFFAVALERAR